jgi:hypothetical protein
VTNILFAYCNFTIEGRTTDGSRVEKSGSTGKGKSITFQDEQPEELTDWNYLEVTASWL